jgi:hypothetical protein
MFSLRGRETIAEQPEVLFILRRAEKASNQMDLAVKLLYSEI